MRRAQTAARSAAGGTNGSTNVPTLVRAKLLAGALPRASAVKVWGSAGSGTPCAACGESILGVAEYEVVFASAVSVSFHRVCYDVWEKERTAMPPEVRGGSSASPWTLLFDLDVATQAASNRAVEELLAASAEALAAAVQSREAACSLRARSRAVRSASEKLYRAAPRLAASLLSPERA